MSDGGNLARESQIAGLDFVFGASQRPCCWLTEVEVYRIMEEVASWPASADNDDILYHALAVPEHGRWTKLAHLLCEAFRLSDSRH